MSEVITTKTLQEELVKSFHPRGSTLESASRKEAIAIFQQSGFPSSKSEEYRFTPIAKAIEKNFEVSDFAGTQSPSTGRLDPFRIPDLDADLIVFVNGHYSEQLSKIISPPEELRIQSLSSALAENASDVQAHFSKLAETRNDPFTALNTAWWQSGVLIRIPDGVQGSRPVVIQYIHDATRQRIASLSRLLVLVGNESQLNLIEKSDSVGTYPVFSSVVEEISVGRRGTLTYTKIQDDAGDLYQVVNTLIHQLDGSRVNTFTLTLNGRMIRNNFGIAIDGEACESHFYGLYLLKGQTLADNHTVVDHRKPNSFSNQLYKGILKGNSKGVFNGKIFVRPHAQKTNAFQSNRNILLTDTATVNTKPQLEIWADDVKCSHGCTTGQLDEEALFYFQSRGISKATAQALLLQAFAGEVIGLVNPPEVKNYLEQILSKRLQERA